MTPQEAQARFGATHYRTMRDGVTPQMYYKQENIQINDGTIRQRWVYLSFADLWMGSNVTKEDEHLLKQI